MATLMEAETRFPYRVDVPAYVGWTILDLLGWCRTHLLVNSYDFHRHGQKPANFVRFYFLRETDAAAFRKRWLAPAGAICDGDVWQAAVLLMRLYGDKALLEAAQRADQLFDDGDVAGCETWHRILDAIERLQAKPAEGEAVH
jgi:hypothetical protein